MFQRKQFTFYRSYYEALLKLPQEQRMGAYEALIRYALDGVAPEGLDAMQEMAFMLIRPTLDSGRKMAKGGTKSKTAKRSDKGREKEKEGEEEIEKENESEIEIEIENEIENELEDDSLLREGFERFWNLYPLKIGKEQTWQVYQEIRPDAGKLCAAVKQWERSSQWNREQGRFIPKPEKFLEEGQFDHLPGDVVPMGASGELGEAEIQAIRRIMES